MPWLSSWLPANVETVQGFADWLAALPPLAIYGVVLAIAYGENVIPPVPGDVAIVVAGSLVALGVLAPVPTLALTIAGSALGFLTMYAVGRQLGAAIHDPRRLRWIPRPAVHTVDAWFERWGLGVVAANRFLAGGRAVIALMAGSSRLPLPQVALWAVVSSVLWCSLLVGGGYAVGSEWERVLGWLRTYGRVMTAAGAVLALGLGVRLAVAWRERRARQRATDDEGGQETAKTPPGAGPAPAAR